MWLVVTTGVHVLLLTGIMLFYSKLTSLLLPVIILLVVAEVSTGGEVVSTGGEVVSTGGEVVSTGGEHRC